MDPQGFGFSDFWCTVTSDLGRKMATDFCPSWGDQDVRLDYDIREGRGEGDGTGRCGMIDTWMNRFTSR